MDVLTKLEEADIDGYDWNWTAKYLDEFVEDLTKAYMASYLAEFPDSPAARASPVPLNAVQRQAAEWALLHGGEEIVGIAMETKLTVRKVVRSGILSGHPVGRIANLVNGDFIFSAIRAARIARTETARALGQGQKGAAKDQGKDEKRWITAGDGLVSLECRMNRLDGWIPIADVFNSGVDTIPQHPNCRCVVQFRASEKSVVASPSADFRCSGCNRLLARSASKGVRIHCRHCKAERIA